MIMIHWPALNQISKLNFCNCKLGCGGMLCTRARNELFCNSLCGSCITESCTNVHNFNYAFEKESEDEDDNEKSL